MGVFHQGAPPSSLRNRQTGNTLIISCLMPTASVGWSCGQMWIFPLLGRTWRLPFKLPLAETAKHVILSLLSQQSVPAGWTYSLSPIHSDLLTPTDFLFYVKYIAWLIHDKNFQNFVFKNITNAVRSECFFVVVILGVTYFTCVKQHLNLARKYNY